MSESKFTPGPWRWEVNMKSKRIQLCGGKPQYDLTVMDFSRWGMNGARPRVLDFSDHMLLREAEDYRVVVTGREHHASWFQGINHPDMNILAAAPDMYEALEATAEALELALSRLGVCGHGDGKDRKADADSFGGISALELARAAIAKAEGKV